MLENHAEEFGARVGQRVGNMHVVRSDGDRPLELAGARGPRDGGAAVFVGVFGRVPLAAREADAGGEVEGAATGLNAEGAGWIQRRLDGHVLRPAADESRQRPDGRGCGWFLR